jgi:predicted RecA/RadA family phage recombinase
MKNFLQTGNSVTVPAPTGGVASGVGVLIGALFGVTAYAMPPRKLLLLSL